MIQVGGFLIACHAVGMDQLERSIFIYNYRINIATGISTETLDNLYELHIR